MRKLSSPIRSAALAERTKISAPSGLATVCDWNVEGSDGCICEVATVFDMETVNGVDHVFDRIHIVDGEIKGVHAFYYPRTQP